MCARSHFQEIEARHTRFLPDHNRLRPTRERHQQAKRPRLDGDSYDNALAETVNGYFTAELIGGPPVKAGRESRSRT